MILVWKGDENMDKHSPKISIKFNGTDIAYKEKRKAVVTGRREEAAVRLAPTEQHHQAAKSPSSSRTTTKRIVLTVSSAVIIGTGLGVSVLEMLGGSQPSGKQSTAIMSNQQTEQPKEISAVIQPVQLPILQTGVFSSKEKGQVVLDELKKKGTPAAMREENGKFYIVSYISNDEDSIKKMGDLLTKKNISFYVKQWSIQQTTVPNALEAKRPLIAKGESMLLYNVSQSTQLYMGKSIDDAEWNRMNKEWDTLTKEANNLERDDIKTFMMSIAKSRDAWNDYKVKKNDEAFTQLQQTLVDGLTAYEKIVTAK